MSEDKQVNRRLTRLEDQIDAILGQLPVEKKEKPSTVKQVQDIIALTATALAAIAATAFIFYAFGYVIVNNYLASYGVRVSELTNPAYIPAGLSFVLAGLLLPSVAIVLAIGFPRPEPSRTKNVLAPTLVTFFATLLLSYLTLSLVKLESPFVWLYPLGSAVIVTLMMGMGMNIWSQQRGSDRIIFTGVIVAFTIIGLILAWSQTVYPNLTTAVGGGRAVIIQFSVSDPENEMLFRSIGIGVDSNLHLTEPVQFIIDTNDAFLVLLNDGATSARIDKKLVTNVRYFRANTDVTGSYTSTVTIPGTFLGMPLQITPSP